MKALTLASLALAIPLLGMAPKSGLMNGDAVPAFHPTHIAGPDKGKDTCPVCTYGNKPMVQVWIHHDDPANVMAIQQTLSKEVAKYASKDLKAFVISVNDCEKCVEMSDSMASKWPSNVALATIDPKNSALKNYKINLEAKNTVMVYVNRTVVANMVNFKADASGMKSLSEAIAKAAK